MAEPNEGLNVKLPTFWPGQAEVWFVQAEAHFSVKGITLDAAKYHHVVASLDQTAATRVLDLLKNPPENGKFEALKTRLLETFSPAEYERASKLFDLPGLCDSSPSCLMDKMLSYLGDHPPCFLFRQLFLRQLPEDIRSHLVASKITDCRELAKAADRLWQARATSTMMVEAAVRTSVPTPSGPRQSTSRPTERPSDICPSHWKFRDKAYFCRHTCRFFNKAPGNGQAGRQ